MLDFTNQVVLVTGAGSAKGMGRVIAQTFGKQGAKVVICDINQAGCDANVEEMKKMGIDATGYAANLTDPEAVKELVNTIVDKYGRIDVLVNNAGISQKVTVADMTLDDIKRIFNVNMFGLFLITQAVCEVMKKQNYGRLYTCHLYPENAAAVFLAELITQLLRPQYLDSLRTLPVKYLLMVSQQTVYALA